MKNVLIVMSSLSNGGAERSLVNFLNEADCTNKYRVDLLLFKRDGQCGFFLPQLPDQVRLLEPDPSLKYLYSPFSWRHPVYGAARLAGTGIARLVSRRKGRQKSIRWKWFYSPLIKKLPGSYDVAAAYISGEMMYYTAEKVSAGKKLVWVHNDYRGAGFDRDMDGIYFRQFDRILSISDTCVDILNQVFPEEQEKMSCVPNLTSAAVIRARSGEFIPPEYHKDQWNLLSIGRLNRQKGFDFAIQAASRMKTMGYRFQWFIIGTGELREMLERQIAGAGVQEQVILLGARENPYPYIRGCDLLVQPSRYEGKSVVLDEAKILGKPVLAANYSTVRDQIQDGREGLIVEMNPIAIADGIVQLMENGALRESIRQYLSAHDYGNAHEIREYEQLLDG